jgi:hypothetical protein
MSTYTPGPWTCDVTDQGGAGRSAYVGVDAPENHQIVARVVCYDDRLNNLPYQANARLIAAAPDMLAALIEVRSSLTELGVDGWSDAPHLLNVVGAAIAKAENRS